MDVATRNKRLPNLPLELVLVGLIVAASEEVSAEDSTVVEVASGGASEATEAVLAIEVGMAGGAVLAIRTVEGLVTDEVGMVALLMPLVVLVVEVGMVVVVVAPMDMTTEETGMAIVEVVVGMEESREALLEVTESPSVAETAATTIETAMAAGATTTMAQGSGNTSLMGTTTPGSGDGTDRAPSTLASFNINLYYRRSWWVGGYSTTIFSSLTCSFWHRQGNPSRKV